MWLRCRIRVFDFCLLLRVRCNLKIKLCLCNLQVELVFLHLLFCVKFSRSNGKHSLWLLFFICLVGLRRQLVRVFRGLIFYLFINRVNYYLIMIWSFPVYNCTSTSSISKGWLKITKFILLCGWRRRSDRVGCTQSLIAFSASSRCCWISLFEYGVACRDGTVNFDLLASFINHPYAVTKFTCVSVFFLLINYNDAFWILAHICLISKHLMSLVFLLWVLLAVHTVRSNEGRIRKAEIVLFLVTVNRFITFCSHFLFFGAFLYLLLTSRKTFGIMHLKYSTTRSFSVFNSTWCSSIWILSELLMDTSHFQASYHHWVFNLAVFTIITAYNCLIWQNLINFVDDADVI